MQLPHQDSTRFLMQDYHILLFMIHLPWLLGELEILIGKPDSDPTMVPRLEHSSFEIIQQLVDRDWFVCLD